MTGTEHGKRIETMKARELARYVADRGDTGRSFSALCVWKKFELLAAAIKIREGKK